MQCKPEWQDCSGWELLHTFHVLTTWAQRTSRPTITVLQLAAEANAYGK